MRIVCLCEDRALFGFLGEWGLSLLIDSGERRVLFDTGFSGIPLLRNSNILGINLKDVDFLVLSHGHVDHTGGIFEFLRVRGKVDVVAHPDVFSPKMRDRSFIGLPFRLEALEGLGAHFILTREPFRLSDNMMTTGEVEIAYDFEKVDPLLRVGDEPDPLLDDLSIVVDGGDGVYVVLGCAHRGVLSILKRASELSGKRVKGVFGGFHLFRSPPERVELTIAELKAMGVERVGACHCTGSYAEGRLREEFGENFIEIRAGRVIEI